ncbi:MAG: FliH/SctL family protein [Bdellovibrionales bacterium]
MSTEAAPNAPVRKYMFDLSFDDATEVHRAPERKPVVMKPEQIDALKKESYDAGYYAGTKDGKEAQVAEQSAILNRIDQNVSALIKNMDAVTQEQENQIRRLALSIAKKILPAFTSQNGLQEIEALVSDTIRQMGREPRLVVRVHEGEFDALNEKIQAIATQRAFAGKIVILADAEVASGDCRIEWADGGIERNTPVTEKSIEQTLLPSS